jgi:hypothetical protein
MQRLILAIALPTNVAHGFMCWGGAPGGTTAAGGYLSTTAAGGDLRTRCHRLADVNQPFARPDMGVARDLIR